MLFPEKATHFLFALSVVEDHATKEEGATKGSAEGRSRQNVRP
jgi:hypothetical protein